MLWWWGGYGGSSFSRPSRWGSWFKSRADDFLCRRCGAFFRAEALLLVAPSVPGIAGARWRGEMPARHGNRAAPPAKRTALSRKCPAWAGSPTRRLPDRYIGGGNCCNRPGNPGNRNNRPVRRLRLPHNPAAVAHQRLGSVSYEHSPSTPAAMRRPNRIGFLKALLGSSNYSSRSRHALAARPLWISCLPAYSQAGQRSPR